MGKNNLPFEFFLARQRRRIKKDLTYREEVRLRKIDRLLDGQHGAELLVIVRGTYGGVSATETVRR